MYIIQNALLTYDANMRASGDDLVNPWMVIQITGNDTLAISYKATLWAIVPHECPCGKCNPLFFTLNIEVFHRCVRHLRLELRGLTLTGGLLRLTLDIHGLSCTWHSHTGLCEEGTCRRRWSVSMVGKVL